MKLLVYGSKGWIGSQVMKYLSSPSLKDIQSIEGLARVDNTKELEKEIDAIKPTHILSLIGRTHGKIGDKVYSTIDYLEEEGKLVDNIRDNLYSPLTLALFCEQKNIHFTYLGTGCIFEFDEENFGLNLESKAFEGKEVNGFTEDSLPNFFGSSYSIVKGFTDRLMHLLKNTLNLRIRMPITGENNPRNFITKITSYEKICSIPNSMTVLPELIPIAIQMMMKNITGTINLTNPGLISHNEILELYKLHVDPDFTWKNFTVDEQNKILSSKRSNNYLETKKLESLHEVMNIKDAVIKCLKEYKITFVPKLKKQKTDVATGDTCVVSLEHISNIDNTENILVTGGCGFIGSHFINHMYKKYDKINIINMDAMYYCANENNVDNEIRNSKRYKLVKGSICSSDLVRHVLETHKINYVVHFAAQSHVQTSFEDALQYTKDNVLGTHTLLECCRLYENVKRFIHVSTDEVYGESVLDTNEKHKTECSVLCPTNPYAGTKAAAELIAQTYIHSFKMPIIITRGNNVYGTNQYPEKLIPKFIKLLKENKKVTIQGNGSAVRGFLHVSDTVNAFDYILSYGKTGEIYNIGCSQNMEYSVMDVAKKLIKLVKKTDNYDDWITYIEDRPFNDARYYISNEKLCKLGWTIQKDFMEGLSELI